MLCGTCLSWKWTLWYGFLRYVLWVVFKIFRRPESWTGQHLLVCYGVHKLHVYYTDYVKINNSSSFYLDCVRKRIIFNSPTSNTSSSCCTLYVHDCVCTPVVAVKCMVIKFLKKKLPGLTELKFNRRDSYGADCHYRFRFYS